MRLQFRRLRPVPAEALPALPPPAPGHLRVLTYNTHHGANARGVLDLEAVAATIEGCQPDVAALQEVDRHWSDRSGGVDQAAWYADRLGLSAEFTPVLVRARRSGPPAEYGLALLSRWPLSSATQGRYGGARSRRVEPRGWQQALLDVPGPDGRVRRVRLLNTHLSVTGRRLRASEAAELVATLSSQAQPDPMPPVVVAGDFNAAPRSRTVRTVRHALLDAWTVGRGAAATTPSGRRLDYLWCSPPLRPVRTVVVRSAASDHYPVVTDLTWT